uniref:Uncharacterized protein n=1 Tax=Pristionchus pacificus TaxID=54126 RepID=A0A2A6BX71_PRIPA|eukprot:PDM70489.1 hypothetical protein PRIPAC_46735 [Pristionchus pacificus]
MDTVPSKAPRLTAGAHEIAFTPCKKYIFSRGLRHAQQIMLDCWVDSYIAKDEVKPPTTDQENSSRLSGSRATAS